MTNGMLLYAHIEPGRRPKMFAPSWGAQAYERYQIPLYLDEIRRVRQGDYTCWTPGVQHLAVALQVLSGSSADILFEELGSTLFASIDKLAKAKQELGLELDLGTIDFRGIEVMPMMSWLAEQLHPGYRLHHRASVGTEPVGTRCEVSKCYQASSYAFRTSQELAQWVSRARFSLQGVFFARGGGDRTVNLLGNAFTVFDRDEFCREMELRGCRLLPLGAANLDYDDTIACDEVFFISHRLTSDEYAAFEALCAQHGLPARSEPLPVPASALRPAPATVGRRSSFMTAGSKCGDGDADLGFRIALDFYDERIAHSFIDNFDVSSLTPEECEQLPVVTTVAGPIEHESGHCYVSRLPPTVEPGDNLIECRRSTLVLTEDGKPLPVSHAMHADIGLCGQGRYSHWNSELWFSTSDNSDPRHNGRVYALCRLAPA